MESALRYHSDVDLSQKNSTHAQLIRLTGRNKQVLEIGPATGYLTEILRSRGCRVWCIENDPEAAKIAAQFCERMVVSDVEKIDLVSTFGDQRFDVVMFGDVLEHLVEPRAALARVATILKPEGYVVASVPNVAHGSLRLSLLRGEFRYTELGLLDRTHLRFFTRETLADLFQQAGYAIRVWRPILMDSFGTEIGLRADDYPPYLAQSVQSDPEALIYQFVVKASPYKVPSNGRRPHPSPAGRSGAHVMEDLWRVDHAIQQKDVALAERDAAVAAKEAAAAENNVLRGEAVRLRREISVRQGELEGALRRLSDVENSIGWRLVNRLRPVLRRVAPRGSRRFRVLVALGRMGFSVASGRPLKRLLAALASPLRALSQAAAPIPQAGGHPRVRRLQMGCYAEHGWSVGGGIAHTLQLLIPMTAYYDVELLLPPGAPLRDREWYRENLLLDSGAIKVRHYSSGIENTYDVWLSVWNERIWPAKTPKRFNFVFFPFVKIDGVGWKHITNSGYSASYLKERYNTDQIAIIPPCVRVDEYDPGPKEPIILHVSRFAMPSAYADKAHIMMIQAFRQLWERGLRGWRLILAGATLDEGESVYAAHLAKHAHGFPVEFALNLPASELRKLYARASIYWHATGFSVNQPAAQEHFGITILEGMASGAVPVVYNSGGPPEIITSGENGYLFDTLDELCENTWSLAMNPDVWKRLSRAARERARYFSPEHVKSLMISTVSGTDKVSIIIGTRDNLEVLKRAVESIFENTPPGYELIIIDNGSSDGTGVYLASLDYPHLRVIRNKNNLGFAAFNNQGQRMAKRPYILYLNDDIEAYPGWLEPLIEMLDSQPKVGAVGSRLLYPDGRVQHDGKMFRKSDLEPRHINMGGRPVSDESPIEVDALTGACLMVRRELAGFSTDYHRGYYEDTDLCMRIKEMGYALVLHRGSVLIHHHGLSMGKNQAATEQAQKRNRRIFMERWREKLPSLVYLGTDKEVAGTDVRCRSVLPPGEREERWPVSRRLMRLNHLSDNW